MHRSSRPAAARPGWRYLPCSVACGTKWGIVVRPCLTIPAKNLIAPAAPGPTARRSRGAERGRPPGQERTGGFGRFLACRGDMANHRLNA
jgi:hypothetical protein